MSHKSFRHFTRGEEAMRLFLLGVLVLPLVMVGCDSGGTGSLFGRHVDIGTSDWAGITRNHEFVCGEVSIQELTAGRTIDIGSITISNDEFNLYVEFNTDDPWVLGTTHLHVGFAAEDLPTNQAGNPRIGNFDYAHERDVVGGAPGVTSDEFVIDLATLNLDISACGTTLYVWAHADAFRLDDGGGIVQAQTAWGGDTPGTSGTRWYFEIVYTLQCCDDGGGGEDGEFRTQTQGGWGTFCHGQNPGCYRNEWFDQAFPEGILIGGGCDGAFEAVFTSSEAIRDFLPSGGKPGPLTGDLEDPTDKTDAGVFLSQLLSLELNLAFDVVDPDFGSSDGVLADQVICNTGTACDGLTIGELADEANLLIADCPGTTGIAIEVIVECVMLMNENFSDGDVDNGLVCAP